MDFTNEQLKVMLGLLLGGGNQQSTSQASDLSSRNVGKYCVFRTYSAGVFCGYLKERSGTEAIVDNCRRIWEWSGAFTLSTVATNGIGGGKMSCETNAHLLTQVIEVIPCSESAIVNLKGYAVHSK
jgi:hypothetical protein